MIFPENRRPEPINIKTGFSEMTIDYTYDSALNEGYLADADLDQLSTLEWYPIYYVTTYDDNGRTITDDEFREDDLAEEFSQKFADFAASKKSDTEENDFEIEDPASVGLDGCSSAELVVEYQITGISKELDWQHGEEMFSEEASPEEIEDALGEKIARMVFSNDGKELRDWTKRKYWRLGEIEYLDSDDVDVENPDELNAAVKKISNGGPSRYILTDGTSVGFTDHVYVSGVANLTKAKFMSLGAIRLTNIGCEIIKEPTPAQYSALRREIGDAADGNGDYTVEISEDDGSAEPQHLVSFTYQEPNPARVVNDLYHYFEDGIKPTGALIN